MASRQRQVIANKWMLSAQAFSGICHSSVLELPKVDLFATSLNNCLPAYVLPCFDPKAMAVDALSSDWLNITLYAFTQQLMMSKLVAKLSSQMIFKLSLVTNATQGMP